ncbi:hypothetical protein T484DRAFT_2988645 [Baffinella frigidus]|nr:hypothetical protein T484DRAFT_2988645 [Cryptophyta sp. CCMP2293]
MLYMHCGQVVHLATSLGKPETRNPKPETRNPKPETLNPNPEPRRWCTPRHREAKRASSSGLFRQVWVAANEWRHPTIGGAPRDAERQTAQVPVDPPAGALSATYIVRIHCINDTLSTIHSMLHCIINDTWSSSVSLGLTKSIVSFDSTHIVKSLLFQGNLSTFGELLRFGLDILSSPIQEEQS